MKAKDLLRLLALVDGDTPVVFKLLDDVEYPINAVILRITNVVCDGEAPQEFTPTIPTTQVVLTS